jgi:hypothetical protein
MMWIKILSAVLLLFNSGGALYGGWHLMTDPTGRSIRLPFAYIEHSFLKDYFIPGLILFCVNGIFGLIALVWLGGKFRYHPQLIILQGILLTGWIVVQVILIRQFYYLQLVFLLMGILFIFMGNEIRKKNALPYRPPNPSST